MMGMTSLDGIKLNVQPAILLTGAAYRGTAIRYTTRLIQPDSGANVGLYSNLTPVSDANITGNRWYLFADPAAAPVYVYGYVNGATAPQVRVFTRCRAATAWWWRCCTTSRSAPSISAAAGSTPAPEV